MSSEIWPSEEDPTISACIACEYNVNGPCLTFRMENYTPPYCISCYFIDYNTTERCQDISITMGNCTSEKIRLKGKKFHYGQWLAWEIYECTNDILEINLTRITGPNWVISAMMIDPISNVPKKSLRNSKPIKVVKIDNKTQGQWMGRYGKLGGILFYSPSYYLSSSDAAHKITMLSSDDDHYYAFNWRTDVVFKYNYVEIQREMDNPLHEYGLNIKG